MTKQLKKPEEREIVYYDYTVREGEDLMPTSSPHSDLLLYLRLILQWLFGQRGKRAAIYSELSFLQTVGDQDYGLVPDIAVILDVAWEKVSSWSVTQRGIAPHIVFEVASPTTWPTDVESKPGWYARLGVREYFVYAPEPEKLGRAFVEQYAPLLGWRRNPARGEMDKLVADAQGRMWSQELESWLVPDGDYLRLTDRLGRLYLTGQEAERQAKEAERRATEAERQAKEAERRARKLAEQKAETMAREKEALFQKLRALGINPDEL